MRRTSITARSFLSFTVALAAALPAAFTTAPGFISSAWAQSGRPAFLGTTCDKVTPYGVVQPAALPPPPPPEPPRPASAAPPPPAPTSFPIPDAPMLPFTAVKSPPPPVGTLWQGVSEVDVMPNGHLLVFQRSAMNMLLEYDEDGRLLRTFDDNIAARAHGIKVDPHGNIWITDLVCHTVMKLAPSGAVLMTLGVKGEAGNWDEAGKHLFNQPNEVAFGKNDEFWVATGHGGKDPWVLHFDKNGKYLNGWSMKHADGSNATLHSMIVRDNGELWIADRSLKQIIVMDQAGKRLKTIQMQNQVSGLYVDAKGGLWMAGGQDGMIMSLDWNGKITGWTGKVGPGNDANEYTEVHYIAVSPDLKYIYVADSLGNRLDKLKRN